MAKLLSIIVPVYNVEKYIRPCIESVFRQGLPDKDYEIIIVNDGTKDSSMEQITDFIGNHANIMVISQENQGLSVARNNGLSRATGEYVMFLDSDDMVAEGSLPLMLDKAVETKADIVEGSFYKLIDGILSPPPYKPVPKDIKWEEWKTGRELFVQRRVSVPVWDKLFRREFLRNNNLQFIPGLLFEDTPFSFECFLKAGKCLSSNNLRLCVYRTRNKSISTTIDLKAAKHASIAIGKTWALRKSVSLNDQEYRKLQSRMFDMFILVLKRNFRCLHGFSNHLRAINDMARYASDLSFSNGRQQKTISFWYNLFPRLLMTFLFLHWKRKHQI